MNHNVLVGSKMLFCSWTHPRVALTVSVTDIRDTLVVLSNRRKKKSFFWKKKTAGNSEFETIKTCSAVANPWLDPCCSRSRFHYFLCVSSLLEKWLKLNKRDVVWYQRVSARCPQDLHDAPPMFAPLVQAGLRDCVSKRIRVTQKFLTSRYVTSSWWFLLRSLSRRRCCREFMKHKENKDWGSSSFFLFFFLASRRWGRKIHGAWAAVSVLFFSRLS